MARDFRDEYKKFQSSPKAKKDRAARNKARREAEKEGRVSKGDGKDINHKDGNPRNGAKSNLEVVSKSENRGRREESRLKGSKRRKPKG